MNDIIEQIALTVIPAIVTYFIGYKQNKVTVDGSQIDNLEKSLEIYQKIIEDLSKKVENLSQHVLKLEGQIDSLVEENKRLKKQMKL